MSDQRAGLFVDCQPLVSKEEMIGILKTMTRILEQDKQTEVFVLEFREHGIGFSFGVRLFEAKKFEQFITHPSPPEQETL